MQNRTPRFDPLQAQRVAVAFRREGVRYLFIGKSGAILLGYPATTQDVDLFPEKSPANGRRIVRALRRLGFAVDDVLERAIVEGRDFVQIKNGPFDIDLVFAPDGLADFDRAYRRREPGNAYPIANIRDIIASKKASGRAKDLMDLALLDAFREVYEKTRSNPLRSARDAAANRTRGASTRNHK